MPVTWASGNKNAGITLSGGNLVATSSAGAGTVNQALTANQTIAPATKQYFEGTVSGTTGQYISVGVMGGNAALNGNVGVGNGSAFVSNFSGAASSSKIYTNASQSTASYPNLVAGQVVRVAIDRAASKIWFAINNNTWSGAAVWMGSGGTTDDPATGVGGQSLSVVLGAIYPAFSSAWTGDVGTLNAGPSFTYAVPAGFSALPSPPTPAGTTWSTTDKTAGFTVSGFNLTAAGSGSSQGIRATDSKTTGQYYFEITASNWTISTACLGIANTSSSLSGMSGPSVGSAVIFQSTGNWWVNGSNTGVSIGGRGNGDVIGIAVDLVSNLIWARVCPAGNWNGNAGFSPGGTGGLNIATIVGAPICPAVGAAAAGGNLYNANFGDTAFYGAVPAGFNAGWPAVGTGGGGAGAAQASAMVLA